MKIRCDSWAAGLTEEQSWALFEKSRRCDWLTAARWAVKEFGLAKMPGHTAFFAWKNAMQSEESAHNLKQAILAQQQAKALAEQYAVSDEDSVKSLMSAATSATLITGNAEIAAQLIESAMSVKAAAQRDIELDLEARRVKVKEQEAAISQRKLEILEARELRAKKVIGDAQLTSEERERRIKEIFGL